MLQRWQGVMAAATGHVAAHEAGAIEYTGHKVIALPAHEGKVKISFYSAGGNPRCFSGC